MAKLPKWKQKLTDKERTHLKEAGINTLTVLKRTRRKQIESNSIIEPCWDCKLIAKKLGFS